MCTVWVGKRWGRGRKEEMRMEEENGKDKRENCAHILLQLKGTVAA